MKTTDIFFAMNGKGWYPLLDINSRATAQLVADGVAGPAYPAVWYRLWKEPDGSSMGQDTYELRSDGIYIIDDRTFAKDPTQPNGFRMVAQQTYPNGMLFLPLTVSEGDSAAYDQTGPWTWHDDKGNVGSGVYKDQTSWDFNLGRLTIHEKYWSRTDPAADFEPSTFEDFTIYDLSGLQAVRQFGSAVYTIARSQWKAVH